MTARIGRREDVAEALLRILRQDLDAAQQEFRARDRRAERVHRVRQRLKRVRTILKIIEPAVGEAASELRATLTHAGQLLAYARDADVAAARARAIAAATAGDHDLGFDRVADTLGQFAAEAHRKKTPVGEITMLFATAGAAVTTLMPDFDGERTLSDAVRRAYAAGRRAEARARRSLATHDLHTWRKRVKELCHLLDLARRRLPPRARRMAKRLRTIDAALGADNDHALLAEKIALMPTADLSLMSQLSAIARRRNDLEAHAFQLGARVYRRRPRAFARRLPLR